MASTEAAPAPELTLDETERAALNEEIEGFAQSLADPRLRARYGELREAAAQGAVPADLVGLLEAMLELILPTGQVRRRQGHEADVALVRLAQRLPRGAALKEAAREVNEALAILRGQTLDGISFTPTQRGHTLSIDTDRCSLSIVIDRSGVRVERVELGA